MSTDRLREMLSEATPGSWIAWGNPGEYDIVVKGDARQAVAECVGPEETTDADARLIALAPDAIALLADMGEAAEEYRFAVRPDPRDYHERQAANDFDAVLARFATFTRDSDA